MRMIYELSKSARERYRTLSISVIFTLLFRLLDIENGLFGVPSIYRGHILPHRKIQASALNSSVTLALHFLYRNLLKIPSCYTRISSLVP